MLAGSWSWDRLAAWVGMFDVDLEIVGPAELKDAAARLSRRYAAAAARRESRRHETTKAPRLWMPAGPSSSVSTRVGEGGVEPPPRFQDTDLNRARLPFRHSPKRRGKG